MSACKVCGTQVAPMKEEDGSCFDCKCRWNVSPEAQRASMLKRVAIVDFITRMRAERRNGGKNAQWT